MKVKVNRLDLVKCLKDARRVLSKGYLAHWSSFLLSAETEAGITVETTDLENTLVMFLPGTVEKPGKCLVAMDELRILEKLKGMDVVLTTEDEGTVMLTCGTFELSCIGLDVENFPIVRPMITEKTGQLDITRVCLDAQEFCYLLRNTIPYASDDDTKLSLHGLRLEHAVGRLRMVASDGHRLAVLDSQATLVQRGFGSFVPVVFDRVESFIPTTIPLLSAKLLLSLFNNKQEQEQIEIVWHRENLERICLEIRARNLTAYVKIDCPNIFPDYQHLLPRDADVTYSFCVQAGYFLQKVRTLSAVISKQTTHRGVRFSTVNDFLRVSVYDSDNAIKGSDVLSEIKVDGTPCDFMVNVFYLTEFLSHLSKDENVTVKVIDKLSPMKIQIESDSSLTHMLMPLNI